MPDERYDTDPIAGMRLRRSPAPRDRVTVRTGLVLEHTESEWCGAVVAVSDGQLDLEDGRGRVRRFPLRDGFLIDGRPVDLVLSAPAAHSRGRARTASGSFAAAPRRARVAQPSRIFVEGRHDAELVEQVWGADLRVEGVVVELLDGADHLEAVLRDFDPRPERRAGVLLDHLVTGSKEQRIAARVEALPLGRHVRIVGHPFVDIWAAVRPERLGLADWPRIPRDVEWKTGVCRALGWPSEDPADHADAWARIRGRVRSFRDLDPRLVGRVEELIDFVTVGS